MDVDCAGGEGRRWLREEWMMAAVERRREVTEACRAVAHAAMAVGMRACELDRVSRLGTPHIAGPHAGRVGEAVASLALALDALYGCLGCDPLLEGRGGDGEA